MKTYTVKYFDGKRWHYLPSVYIQEGMTKNELSTLLDDIRQKNNLPGYTYLNISNFNHVIC